MSLLIVRDLAVRIGAIQPVAGVSFDIAAGETFTLLGESGCGKSMTALALMRLLPPLARITRGEVNFAGRDLFAIPEAGMRELRGGGMAMIFQEPATSLNPVMTIGAQIGEVLRLHGGKPERVIELLELVGIPDPARRASEYPFQLSGGMKQRSMIAMALAGDPKLLIADEPTTALDVTIQAQVLDLLKRLQRERGMAMLLITHDLGVVARMADRVGVMHGGQLVEVSKTEPFFRAPAHEYSRRLFAALPENLSGGRTPSPPNPPLEGEGNKGGCPLEGEGNKGGCLLEGEGHAALLAVENLSVHFPIRRGLLQRTVGYVRAVDGVSLKVSRGATLAVVGESGCGKTTAGKAILHLLKPAAGRISFGGEELKTIAPERMQMVFQDPFGSLNPRLRIGRILAEGMRAQGVQGDVGQLLEQVGLDAAMASRYPHEFSGGQRQRIAIARALAVNPQLLICDEPTSALDVSVQAQILKLLRNLQQQRGLSYLFITHNIAVVDYLAHEVAVMYLGRIVEQGTADDVLRNPQHPYTQALMAAVPRLDGQAGTPLLVPGDPPSPANPPTGCHFHPRCPHALPACKDRYPDATPLSGTHSVRCFIRFQGSGSRVQ
ncbi:MAG: ABC transporter ATP-binding protein [Zoogloeaceae bacterium]|jgi:peptide/nickel transport system ATP-binding protein|nr:ABC transporter ATP-binding protein [Zoogloeaceae bacterium]